MFDSSSVDHTRELLKKQANRASASILGYKDRECDYYLPDDVSDRLRKVVLDQMNRFLDLAVDCVRVAADNAEDPDSSPNFLYMEKRAQ